MVRHTEYSALLLVHGFVAADSDPYRTRRTPSRDDDGCSVRCFNVIEDAVEGAEVVRHLDHVILWHHPKERHHRRFLGRESAPLDFVRVVSELALGRLVDVAIDVAIPHLMPSAPSTSFAVP